MNLLGRKIDPHVEQKCAFQIERRGLTKAWVEMTILNPDAVEVKGDRQRFFKRLPGRRVMLRVVTPARDPEYVITAYFDRTKPCA
jgi:hypothetical protein